MMITRQDVAALIELLRRVPMNTIEQLWAQSLVDRLLLETQTKENAGLEKEKEQ